MQNKKIKSTEEIESEVFKNETLMKLFPSIVIHVH